MKGCMLLGVVLAGCAIAPAPHDDPLQTEIEAAVEQPPAWATAEPWTFVVPEPDPGSWRTAIVSAFRQWQIVSDAEFGAGGYRLARECGAGPCIEVVPSLDRCGDFLDPMGCADGLSVTLSDSRSETYQERIAIALHEFGHVMGLLHSDDIDDLMALRMTEPVICLTDSLVMMVGFDSGTC